MKPKVIGLNCVVHIPLQRFGSGTLMNILMCRRVSPVVFANDNYMQCFVLTAVFSRRPPMVGVMWGGRDRPHLSIHSFVMRVKVEGCCQATFCRLLKINYTSYHP